MSFYINLMCGFLPVRLSRLGYAQAGLSWGPSRGPLPCYVLRRGPAPAPAYYPATLHHTRASLPESHLHDLVIFNRRIRPPQQLKYLPVVGEVTTRLGV